MKLLQGRLSGALAGLALGVALLATSLEVAAQAAPRVAIATNAGTMVVELNPAKAPISVENFLAYAKKGYYNGTIFHRVIENFMIQGGALEPNLREKPGAGPAIVNEAANGLKNERGTIAMARLRGINTASTQWFINTVDNPFLDHIAVPPQGITVTRGGRQMFVSKEDADSVYGYAVFGKVVEGLDVLDRIRRVETRPAGPHQNVPLTPIVIEKVTVLN